MHTYHTWEQLGFFFQAFYTQLWEYIWYTGAYHAWEKKPQILKNMIIKEKMKYNYASEQTWLFKRPNQTTWKKTHWLLLRQIWRFSWGSPSPSVGSPPGRHALGAHGGFSVPHSGLSLVCSGWCYLAPQPGAWQGAPAHCHSPTRRTRNRPPPTDLWPSSTGLLTEQLPGTDFNIFKKYKYMYIYNFYLVQNKLPFFCQDLCHSCNNTTRGACNPQSSPGLKSSS